LYSFCVLQEKGDGGKEGEGYNLAKAVVAIIRNIWVAYSQKIFEEREEVFYQSRQNMKGKSLHLIEEVLREKDFSVERLNMDKPLQEFVESLPRRDVDLVFNLAVRASEIYDQAFLPSLLDALRVPYLGSNATVHSLCLDRSLIKLSLRGIGIPCPSSFVWYPGIELPESLDYPLIVKPRFRTHFSPIAMNCIVNNQDELIEKLDLTFSETHEKVLVEKYLHGREMVIGIIGNGDNLTVLPILEVKHDEETMILQSYLDGATCPAPLQEDQQIMLEGMAARLFNELNMRDYASFHLILDQKENIPFFFEINSLPLLYYRHSAFPQMYEATGMDYKGMIARLLEVAKERIGDFA